MQRSVPHWVADAVFYQIFPDRFRKGSEDWEADPHTPADRAPCGGDLAGIHEAISYLGNLGITALYLTPIFHADSYHKYDTVDYFAIDPDFGSNEEFRDLVSRLHKQGIRVVLDGVFNHCSDHHPFFQDVIENGSLSPYWDWFTVTGDHVMVDPEPNYACWAGVKKMPEWNHDHPAVSEYLLSVVRHWIDEYHIDGWRLDTTEYLPPDFVRAIYQTAHTLSPDVYVLGEVMGLGTPWFRHHALDGVMHYKLLEAITEFLAKETWDAHTFWHSVRAHWYSYPEDANFSSYTLLSSHDRPRFLTQCHGDLDRFRLALAFQFAFPGPPAIYYGDEIGLQGGEDPDNRRRLPWDESHWNHDLVREVRQLIHLRTQNEVLRHGSISCLYAEDRFLVIERVLEAERFLIVLNADRHSDARFVLPEGNWIDAFTHQEQRGDQMIPALSYRYFRTVN
ncbi:glycoside hydrolase family 13 protein [Candidatus Bipolaricaulota bacterium]|nr:glycoside hydrolase family 13 protein [Candidatus Bipolaricaulota bacterium]